MTARRRGSDLDTSARLRVDTPAAAGVLAGVGGLGARGTGEVGADLGDDIAASTRAVTRRGAAIFPVSGEIHYSRIPRELWDDVLRRARAGGLTHVATYAMWNHHEPVRGERSFSDDLDLRSFLELARSHGLEVILRVGPYVHAEVRHGGLPDWIVESGLPVRTNDPGYLAEVAHWYEALGAEVRGIPLFAIQVDNELYDRPEHLTALRELATASGLRAPLWTATAWGGAQLPDGVLPSYGGYSDSFWIDADDGTDERSLSNFYASPRRDDDGIGADHREASAIAPTSGIPEHPFATCELGAGMVSAYHRRPVVSASDVDALALAKLASGSAWQGYYMYADGRNPRRHLQEAQAQGAPNDFTELGYDFGAPLTVDGVPRESWFRLRRQHLFLARWGSAFADMPAFFPPDAPDHPDTQGLRWSVRSDGSTGFVFVINHQPHTDLPPHDGIAFDIDTPAGAVVFPMVDIPPGAAFFWPFRLMITGSDAANVVGSDAVELTWATGQPITQVEWRDAPLLVLTETAGIPFAFDTAAEATPLELAGPGRWWELSSDGAVRARLLVLSEADGLRLGLVGEQLVLASGAVSADRVEFFGRPSTRSDHRVVRLEEAGWVRTHDPDAAAHHSGIPVSWRLDVAAGPPPAGSVSAGGRAAVPTDWSGAAVFDLDLHREPGDPSTLVVQWSGDVARAWDGDRLVSDALWNGREWRISAPQLGTAATLRVEILPAPPTSPVYFGVAPAPGASIASAAHELPRTVSNGRHDKEQP